VVEESGAPTEGLDADWQRNSLLCNPRACPIQGELPRDHMTVPRPFGRPAESWTTAKVYCKQQYSTGDFLSRAIKPELGKSNRHVNGTTRVVLLMLTTANE